MMGMSTAGAYLAFMKHQMNNVFGGILAFYLVTTAWATARRGDGETGIFDWGALLVALAVGAIILTYGFEVANSPTGPKDGIPVGMCFFLGSVALLSAAGDVRMLVRGGVFAVHRIARHLWRMCFSLFIATGSFFLGQQQVSSLVTQNKRAFYPGYPASDIADFLAVPSSLHQRIQEKIHTARRCLLLTDLAFELTSQ